MNNLPALNTCHGLTLGEKKVNNKTPRILLPLLSPPTLPNRGRWARLLRNAERENDCYSDQSKVQNILCRAIEDMRALVGHVGHLMNHPAAEQTGMPEWLVELYRTLNEIEQYVRRGFYERDQATIDSDGISSLDQLLNGGCNLDMLLDQEGENTELLELLARLISYWDGEIRARGYELIDILLCSIPAFESEKYFDTLDQIKFPGHQADTSWLQCE